MPETTNQILNELIPLVRTRLADPLPPKRQYARHGQPNQRPQQAVQANIFSNKEIKSFLKLAAMEVSTLVQTDISVPMVDRFDGFIVDYAVIVALSTKALIEKGREFKLSDNGIKYSSPSVSEMLHNQYAIEYHHFMEKIKVFVDKYDLPRD